MPTIKLTFKLPSPWLFAGLLTLLLWLTIWFVWPNWLFLVLLLLLTISFIALAYKQENKIRVIVAFLIVVLVGNGLLFAKNFKIERKGEDEKKEEAIKAKKLTPLPSPTSKYEIPLKIAKQCALGASPCNKQLFDWNRITQIVVVEETIPWDPLEDSEFWMIQKPPPEVEARLVNKEVWRVYFEVPPKPPTGRIQHPDESVRITIDKESKKVTDVQQGWGPAFITTGQGEAIPESEWP